MKLILEIVFGVGLAATLAQFVRLARPRFQIAFWVTLVLACFLLAGCATQRRMLSRD